MARFKRLQEQAYDYLKELLLTGRLEDGVVYSETKVAGQVGISRTPMRDALQKLEQEGYIDILPSKGFALKRLSPAGIVSNGQIRSALECYCALLLAKEYRTVRARQTLETLDGLLARQQEWAGSAENLSPFLESDMRFHCTIVEYSQNEELQRIFYNHLHYIQRMAKRTLAKAGRMEATVKEHRDICDAIRYGDAANIYSITMLHMKNSEQMYLQEAQNL